MPGQNNFVSDCSPGATWRSGRQSEVSYDGLVLKNMDRQQKQRRLAEIGTAKKSFTLLVGPAENYVIVIDFTGNRFQKVRAKSLELN